MGEASEELTKMRIAGLKKDLIYCPNCQPDYLNFGTDGPRVIGYINSYGVGITSDCNKCGVGYSANDIDFVVKLWIKEVVGCGEPDHLSDALAVFLVARRKVREFVKLREEWKAKGERRLPDFAGHVLNLAYMARNGHWAHGIDFSKLQEDGTYVG